MHVFAVQTHSSTPPAVHFLFDSTLGRVLLLVVVLAVAALFMPPLRAVLAPLWRLATGGLVLERPGPWDSSWLYPAPLRPAERPAFRGERYPRTRWGRLPGYQRMAIRWAVVGYVVALETHPYVVLSVSGAVLVALMVRQSVRLLHNWGLNRSAGLFAAGAAQVLKYGDRDPATWIAVPGLRLTWLPVPVAPELLRAVRRVPRIGDRLEHVLGALAVPVLRVPLDDDDARVRISVDAEITNKALIAEVSELAMARLPEGPWAATHHQRDLAIELRHPKRPPAQVWYDADANQQFPIDEVPIGQRAGGAWATLPLKRLTPHVVASASTGWGKTTMALVYVAHTAGNGGRVLINDPKRIGFLRPFGGLRNVTIRTTVEGWIATVDEFNTEMQRRYEIIERFPEIADDPELYFQPWFLVTDERGSYVSEIKDDWKARGEKGTPPALRQEKLNLWQSRAAAMYMFDLAQQANLNVFLDSDGRDQRMARIAAGPQTRSSWMMLFPGTAKVKALMKKGRAMLGIGPDDVEEIQLAQVSIEDARAFAEAGAALGDMENKERAKRLTALTGESVPAGSSVPSPGETRPSVPGQREDGQTWSELDQDSRKPFLSVINGELNKTAGENVRDDVSGSENGTDSDPENELIVGLQAGADYLEMSLANFEKSRSRRRIAGELRRGTQPAWRRLDLQEWRAQAPRAGRQAVSGDE